MRDDATLHAQKRAHHAFDQLWLNGAMTRNGAYRWMRKVLRIKKRHSHIRLLSVEQCENLMKHVHAYHRKK